MSHVNNQWVNWKTVTSEFKNLADMTNCTLIVANFISFFHRNTTCDPAPGFQLAAKQL